MLKSLAYASRLYARFVHFCTGAFRGQKWEISRFVNMWWGPSLSLFASGTACMSTMGMHIVSSLFAVTGVTVFFIAQTDLEKSVQNVSHNLRMSGGWVTGINR